MRRLVVMMGVVMSVAVQPLLAQASSGSSGKWPLGRCYDLFFQVPAAVSQSLGRIEFDTTAVTSRLGNGFKLVFVAGRTGFGAPHGSWRLGGGDSLLLSVVYIDSGTRFGFPKSRADTLRGLAQEFGMVADTVTQRPAMAVRRMECGG